MQSLLNFIEKELVLKKAYCSNLEQLKKLEQFLEDNKINLSKKICFDIFGKSKKLNDIIASILYCEEYVEEIDNNSFVDEVLEYYSDFKNDNFDINSSLKNYINSIPSKILTNEEERELFRKYRNGDSKAREKIILHNLRIVISIAKRYNGFGFDLLDLIQDGNEGLMIAVEKFDLIYSNKFCCYAKHWIRQSIVRSIMNRSKTIRIPVGIYENLLKVKKAKSDLEEALYRTPTAEEISEYLSLPIYIVNMILDYEREPVSINTPLFDSPKETIADTLFDSNSNVEVTVLNKVYYEQFIQLMKEVLTERELNVLFARNGIGGQREKTLDEIGKELGGITRQAIFNIETKALKKVKNNIKDLLIV